MPIIRYNIRKIYWIGLEKSLKMLILGQSHLLHSGYHKNFPLKSKTVTFTKFWIKKKSSNVFTLGLKWPIYPNFSKTKTFLKKGSLSLFSVYWFLASCKKWENKVMGKSLKKAFQAASQTDRDAPIGLLDRVRVPKKC